jgi:hypothetical protein
MIEDNADHMLRERRQTFRFDTYGDDAWAQAAIVSARVTQ